jgi:hypothetical protein
MLVSFLILDTTDISTAQNGFFEPAVSIDSNPLDGLTPIPSRLPATFRISCRSDLTTTKSIGTLDPPFKVISGGGTFNLPKGKTEKVTVQFNPTAKGAAAQQTLIITSDDPKHPMHNETATGSGK